MASSTICPQNTILVLCPIQIVSALILGLLLVNSVLVLAEFEKSVVWFRLHMNFLKRCYAFQLNILAQFIKTDCGIFKCFFPPPSRKLG